MRSLTRFALVALAVSACSSPVVDRRAAPTEPVSLRSEPLESYIVQLRKDAGPSSVWAKSHGVSPKFAYLRALNGFAAMLSASAAAQLASDPQIASVTKDGVMVPSSDQLNPPWNLDRIDQRVRTLDGIYHNGNGGAGVHVYDVDTGINPSHVDFAGRIGNGVNFSGGNSADVTDCHGHGTHTAGTIGGTTYGVAKAVILHPVRVFNCTDGAETSVIVAGIDWVMQNAVAPAVINMSLGGPPDPAMDQAVENAVAAGIVVVVSAGNGNTDACSQSPARSPNVITVASSDINDLRASTSNYGSCVDLFAPGVNVVSDWYTSPTATMIASGTSMAAPAVSGTAALLRAENRAWTPRQIDSALYRRATKSVVIDAKSARFHVVYTGPDDMVDTIPPPPAPVPSPAPSNLSASFDSVSGKGNAQRAYITIRWADYGIGNVMTDVRAVNPSSGSVVWFSALPGVNALVDVLPLGRWDFFARTRWYQGSLELLDLMSVLVGPVHVDACGKGGACK